MKKSGVCIYSRSRSKMIMYAPTFLKKHSGKIKKTQLFFHSRQ